MKQNVALTRAEQNRVHVLNQVLNENLTAANAAELFSLSVGQVRPVTNTHQTRRRQSAQDAATLRVSYQSESWEPWSLLVPTARAYGWH